jgi:cytochrome c-type biogenesis protein CcmH/NrfG
LSPKDADFWVQLGRCYAKVAGKEKEAEKALLEATRLDPEETDNLLELARYYQNQGLLAKAIEVYEQILTVDPQNFTAQSAINELRNEEKSSNKSSLISRLSFWRKKED